MLQKRSVRLKIGLAFLAVIAGFVAAVTYVPLALWPSVKRAEDIQHSYAEAVRGLAELRGCGFAIRTGALMAYQARWDDGIDRGEQEKQIAAARQRCEAALSRFPSTDANAEALAAWRHFTEIDVPAHEEAVDALVAASHAASPDPHAVRRLLETSLDGDRRLEALMSVLAAKAKAEAEQIHTWLRRLSTGYLLMAGVGAIGGLVLVLEALRILKRFTRAADERVEDLEAFDGQVAHDLRGPLHTIRLSAHAIASRTRDEAVRRHAQVAERCVTRLDGLISDLLEFARSGVGGEGSPRAVTDVATVVRETCEEMAPAAEQSGIELIGRAPEVTYARVPAAVLKTIITNLVGNALKHGAPTQDKTVEVTATARGDEVQLAVEDHGAGIPRNVLSHLFEPFFSGSNRRDSYGLGLATVKRLVDRHSGTITVESQEGRGTRFVVRLPAGVGHDDVVPSQVGEAPAALATAPHERVAAAQEGSAPPGER